MIGADAMLAVGLTLVGVSSAAIAPNDRPPAERLYPQAATAGYPSPPAALIARRSHIGDEPPAGDAASGSPPEPQPGQRADQAPPAEEPPEDCD